MQTHKTDQDVTVLNDLTEIPGLGFLPVNAFVIHAEQPVVIDTGLGTEDKDFVTWLSDALDPADFAARTHVLPAIHRASGMGLDLVMAGTGIEALFFARSRRQQVEGVSIPVASPEDIIVMKILAGRPKDLDDAGAILAAQGEGTDVELVRQTLRELEQALDRSDLVAALHSLLGKIAT